MKHTDFTACLLSAAAMLGAGCSESSGLQDGMSRRVGFEVEIAAAAPLSRGIAEPPLIEGSCVADRVRVLVFKNAAGSVAGDTAALKTFLFDQLIVADARKDAGTENWIARGSFNVQSTATYRVWGVAYNSADEALLSADYTGTNYYRTPVEVLPPPAGSLFDYKTPEFFKGKLLAKGSAAELIRGSEAAGGVSLHGDLYRVSGRAVVEINNIPDSIVSLALLVEKFTASLSLTDETALDDLYLGKPTAVAVGTFKVAATDTFTSLTDGRGRTATLEADLFKARMEEAPLPSGSAYFIDATDKNGATVRYMIRAADKWVNTPYILVVEKVVDTNLFRIPENYRLYIHGDFEKLKTGNVLIDATPITDEYFGGTLDPVDG